MSAKTTETDQSPVAQTAASAFFEGFAAPWHGFLFMRRNPSLWPYAAMPILLNVVISVFVLALLVLSVIVFSVYIHPSFPEGAKGLSLEIASIVLLLILAIGIAAAVWMLLGGILCGYYYEKLAREVELKLGTRPEDLKEIGLRYQIADTFRDFSALAVVNAGLLFVHCIPVLGSIVGVCGALYFNCYIFGVDYFDFPLALRGMRRKEKREFIRRHRSHTLGLGAVVVLFNLVPVFGAVILTTAAIGAVLLHRRLNPRD